MKRGFYDIQNGKTQWFFKISTEHITHILIEKWSGTYLLVVFAELVFLWKIL